LLLSILNKDERGLILTSVLILLNPNMKIERTRADVIFSFLNTRRIFSLKCKTQFSKVNSQLMKKD